MRLWYDAVELDREFFEKDRDRRGGRLGFPPLVAEELNALYIYWAPSRAGAV
jgi:hypothetical protein